MKICPKCGAIWEDNRNTCLDCDTVLPNALSAEAAEEVREDVSDSLYDMAENADDFAVSPREKVFGILSFVGCVAGLVLFVLASTKYNATASPIVRSVMELATLIGLFTPLFFAVSGCLFLFPRLMWNLYTLRYRWFYNWDTTPSDYAILGNKIAAYILCIGSMIVLLYGVSLYI